MNHHHTCVRRACRYQANQSSINALWAGGSPPPGVGRACANPALTSLVAWPPYPREAPGTDTAWCFCANHSGGPSTSAGTDSSSGASVATVRGLAVGAGPSWGDCRSEPSVPEQIMVVLGQSNSAVVSFVTLWEPGFGDQADASTPPLPPRAMFSVGSSGVVRNASGVTHMYQSPAPDPGNASDPVNRYWNVTARNYSFHFVKLTNLPEGENISYRVASGATPTVWSDVRTFRAPFGPSFVAAGRSAPGETVVALFGDMGVYAWNSLENLEVDLNNGRLDAVFHIGAWWS
jgi:hypothetical protein